MFDNEENVELVFDKLTDYFLNKYFLFEDVLLDIANKSLKNAVGQTCSVYDLPGFFDEIFYNTDFGSSDVYIDERDINRSDEDKSINHELQVDNCFSFETIFEFKNCPEICIDSPNLFFEVEFVNQEDKDKECLSGDEIVIIKKASLSSAFTRNEMKEIIYDSIEGECCIDYKGLIDDFEIKFYFNEEVKSYEALETGFRLEVFLDNLTDYIELSEPIEYTQAGFNYNKLYFEMLHVTMIEINGKVIYEKINKNIS